MDVLNCLFVFGLGSVVDDGEKLDIIRKLPIEISVMILRMLDGETLLNVEKVSKKWYNICQSDKVVRQKVGQYKRELKLKKCEMILGRTGQAMGVPKDESTVFRVNNIQLRTNARPKIQVLRVNNRVGFQPLNIKTIQVEKNSAVPFVVLQSNGNSELHLQKKRKIDEVRGIGLAQKRRLRRL